MLHSHSFLSAFNFFRSSKNVHVDFSYALSSGTDLRGYVIEKMIHRGGMSWVYLGRDRKGLTVIIKEFFPHASAARAENLSVYAKPNRDSFYREAFRRFHEEGRMLGIFEGPTFARGRTFFRLNNTGYLVLEKERGRTLHSYVSLKKRVPRSWREIQPFVLDVRNSILEMHRQRILHLDIHPSNIMLNLRGRAVLLDFGAARHVAEPILSDSRFITPGFSAPEIVAGARWGTWSDVYSFGACLKAAGVFRDPGWPIEIQNLARDCLHESLSQRILTFDDPRMDVLLDRTLH